MKIRKVPPALPDELPGLIWNYFVDLISAEEYEDLDPVQRPAHLVFWYEAEVQNGGHMQYFENPTGRRAGETISALVLLGAVTQAKILERALETFRSRPRPKIETAEEFCEVALQGEFRKFDSEFAACSPTLNEVMERYLAKHQTSFVELT